MVVSDADDEATESENDEEQGLSEVTKASEKEDFFISDDMAGRSSDSASWSPTKKGGAKTKKRPRSPSVNKASGKATKALFRYKKYPDALECLREDQGHAPAPTDIFKDCHIRLVLPATELSQVRASVDFD